MTITRRVGSEKKGLPNTEVRMERYRAGVDGELVEREYVLETTHHGVVLGLREYNGRDDSDFVAICWNAEEGTTYEVLYASTRWPSYENGASIDATPEIKTAYHAMLDRAARARVAAEAAKEAEERAKRLAEYAKRDAGLAKAKALKGTRVRVKAARGKTPVEGVLFWYAASGSGKSARVGVKDENGAVTWTSAERVEPVDRAFNSADGF